MGKNEQGILFEHREAEWGDMVDIDEVLMAVKKIYQACLALLSEFYVRNKRRFLQIAM